MSVIQSIFLGLVQGITEFLPVSSSGHLTIIRNLLGIETDGGLLFDVLVHLGTLAALVCVFHKDILRMLLETARMLRDLFYNLKTYIHNRREQDARRYRKIVHNNYRRFVMLIFAATIPTAVIGYAARDLVAIAGQTLIVPGVCLILNACLLLVADVTEEGKQVPKTIHFTNGFLIGVAQGLSALPGLSRSGTTIAASLMSGFDRRFAVKYSFIMSIPVILGANLLEIGELSGGHVSAGQIAVYLLGAAVAGVTGYFSIRKMLTVVRRKKFKGFAVYCLILGIIAIAGHFALR